SLPVLLPAWTTCFTLFPYTTLFRSQFFSNVRQQTEPIFQLLELWEETALQTIKTERFNVHPQQIISTKENMQLLLMHSFYKDVRDRKSTRLNSSHVSSSYAVFCLKI